MKRFRSKRTFAPIRRETPEEAKARRMRGQRRKAPPSSTWWREQMLAPQPEPVQP